MSELDIRKWLSNITETVRTRDLTKHMDLISENVVVYGMPKGPALNYSDWYDRRKNEFDRGTLKDITYHNLQVKNYGLRRLIFNIEEVMDASSGDMVIIHKQIILEHEQDDQWRAVEESIKNFQFLKAHKTN